MKVSQNSKSLEASPLISNLSSHCSEALGYFYYVLMKCFIVVNKWLAIQNTAVTKLDHIHAQESESFTRTITVFLKITYHYTLHNSSATSPYFSKSFLLPFFLIVICVLYNYLFFYNHSTKTLPSHHQFNTLCIK